MASLRELIYSPETVAGEAASKSKSHTPKLEAPDTVVAGEPFKVKITVGPHPSKPEHYIGRIELYFYEEGRTFNPTLLASVNLAPSVTEPAVELTLKLEKSGVLYALAYCNLHGLWESRKTINVKQA